MCVNRFTALRLESQSGLLNRNIHNPCKQRAVNQKLVYFKASKIPGTIVHHKHLSK
jgi:hypothetical protein